jgi:hypothetical protein
MSRQKFAIPQTMVPGATRRVDPETLLPMVSVKNKVPLWDMPTPVRYVEHVRRRLDKKTKTVVMDKVMVPIYRGIPSSLARLIRGEYRRTQRKADEARKADLSKAAAAHEATMKMQGSIINPGGHNVGE